MKQPIHLVFAGGGTAGHLFPGLAVARQLAAEIRRLRITFTGGGKDFERRHVAASGFDYFALPCRPLPRAAREAVSFVVENIAGYLAAKRFLRDEQVSGVIGLGGYASMPMGRAAAKCHVPLVLLEQNVVPGRATRWLAPSAQLVCASFPQSVADLRHRCATRLTGNPIRHVVARPESTSSDAEMRPRQLLVLGGSGGARSLNDNVPRALYKAHSLLAGWRIVHQSGEADLDATRELYRKLDIDATVSAFVADVPEVLAVSDLAICRAGGTTLAELAAAGVPTVLLPYPHATDDHQRRNADVFVAAGGALLVDERQLTGRLDDQLAETVGMLVAEADRLAAMSQAMLGLGRPDAAADVAALVWSVVSSQARRSRLPAAA
jgi:UDP-N-acetylglucosamine--N-acetylmuramyl-(pentapeptide) pyrophosphoryl-undecaprenol N-acetylglucosamine transferase